MSKREKRRQVAYSAGRGLCQLRPRIGGPRDTLKTSSRKRGQAKRTLDENCGAGRHQGEQKRAACGVMVLRGGRAAQVGFGARGRSAALLDVGRVDPPLHQVVEQQLDEEVWGQPDRGRDGVG